MEYPASESIAVGVAEPGVIDADSASKSHFAIHDQQFAVAAMIDVWFHLIPVLAGVDHKLDPRRTFIAFHVGNLGHFKITCAVHQRMDFDSRLGALGQRIDELIAHLAGRPDVGFEADRFPRLADGVEVIAGKEFPGSVDQWGDRCCHRTNSAPSRGPTESRKSGSPTLIVVSIGTLRILAELR